MPPTRRRPPAGRPQRPPAGSRGRARPLPRPPIRWSTRIAGGLALLVITASGLGHAVVNGVNDAISRVDAFGGMQGRPGGSKGTNFLLVGTDGRAGLGRDEKQRYHLGGTPCHCTDTIMLVHLSEDRQRASIVSIPRDSYVRLPGAARAATARTGTARTGTARTGTARTGAARPGARAAGPAPSTASGTHPAKINEAYADGGPKLTVRTVERLTGVHIDHYLEVDFVSFMKTVDVLGGVQVCTAAPLRDSFTGLDLPVGTSTLGGGRALQYVRARHLDGASDLGRMQRQQRFLAQVIERITSGDTLHDPVAVSRIATTVLGSVRADQGLRPTDLIGLARGMQNFSPHSSEFASVPLSDVDQAVPGVGSTVRWDDRKAGRLWASIRADRPLAVHHKARHSGRRVQIDPSQIRVRVANGTGTSGLAAAAQRSLHDTGFLTPGPPSTAGQRVGRTVIRYDPRWDRSVRSLAAALPGAELIPVAGQGPVMAVTLGPDFTKVTPVTAAPGPADGAVVGEDAVTGDEVTCA